MAGPVPALRRGTPFSTAAGLEHLPWSTIRGPSYRALIRGVHVEASVDVDHGLLVRAMRESLGAEPVLLGPSAGWALGSRLADPTNAVHVAVPPARRVQPCDGIVVHRTVLDPACVRRSSLGRTTDAARTVVDLARGIGTRHLDAPGRVAWVDDLLYVTGLSTDRARAAVMATVGLQGIAAARRVVHAARDGVESVKETELRLLVRGLGFPEPTVQCVVRTATGLFLGRLDLGWPHLRTGLEYDGAVHQQRIQHSLDLARHNRLRAEGWVVLQVDARSLAAPTDWIRQLRAALAR